MWLYIFKGKIISVYLEDLILHLWVPLETIPVLGITPYKGKLAVVFFCYSLNAEQLNISPKLASCSSHFALSLTSPASACNKIPSRSHSRKGFLSSGPNTYLLQGLRGGSQIYLDNLFIIYAVTISDSEAHRCSLSRKAIAMVTSTSATPCEAGLLTSVNWDLWANLSTASFVRNWENSSSSFWLSHWPYPCDYFLVWSL